MCIGEEGRKEGRGSELIVVCMKRDASFHKGGSLLPQLFLLMRAAFASAGRPLPSGRAGEGGCVASSCLCVREGLRGEGIVVTA